MRGQPIKVSRPQLPTADRLRKYLLRIDQTRWYSNWGPLVGELETRLAALLGGAHVASANSGSAGLSGAILARAGRGTPPRNLALVPSFTFIATATAAEMCGYEVVFADVSEESWAMTPETAARRPDLDRIGIVIPVAPFGRPQAQEPWTRFEDETRIPVVIDGAASFDRVMGDPGRYIGRAPAVFSFHATKSFGAGEGGAVACSDEVLKQRIVRALNFGVRENRDAEAPGLNGKMSEYHAAVALAELDCFEQKLARYASVADRYRGNAARFRQAGELVLTPSVSACYALLRCPSPGVASGVRAALDARSFGHIAWYCEGLARHTRFAPAAPSTPVSEKLGRTVIGLPMSVDLDGGEIDSVAEAIWRATSPGDAALPRVAAQ